MDFSSKEIDFVCSSNQSYLFREGAEADGDENGCKLTLRHGNHGHERNIRLNRSAGFSINTSDLLKIRLTKNVISIMT